MFMLLAVTAAAALTTVSELNELHKLANARFTRDQFVIVSLSSVEHWNRWHRLEHSKKKD